MRRGRACGRRWDQTMGLPEVVKGRGFGSQQRMSPFLSNPNQTKIYKNIKIEELSRETHLVQMTSQASFLLTRRITSTSSQE
jgi:hypothetical protein